MTVLPNLTVQNDHQQNVRFWASENPRVIHEKVHRAPRIAVRVAIPSHGLLGPIFFEETVYSDSYLTMFRNTLCPTFWLQVCRYKLSG
jgi:hypothetical protein